MFNLWFHRHSSGCPSQCRSFGINRFVSGAQVIAELERKTDELTEEKLSGFENEEEVAPLRLEGDIYSEGDYFLIK